MKYIIVGRTGTGKNLLLSTLANAGLRPLKTHTDRDRRFPEEDTYYFHTKEESKAIPRKQKLLYTMLNNDERFALAKDIQNMDVCILDPSGFYELCGLFPQEPIHLIHVTANAEKARRLAGERHEDFDTGIAIYDERYFDENGQFADFEEMVAAIRHGEHGVISNQGNVWPANCMVIHGLENPLDDPAPIKNITDAIMAYHKTVQNAMSLVDIAIELNCVNIRENDPEQIELWRDRNGTPKMEYVNREMFADLILADTEGLAATTHAILSNTPIRMRKEGD